MLRRHRLLRQVVCKQGLGGLGRSRPAHKGLQARMNKIRDSGYKMQEQPAQERGAIVHEDGWVVGKQRGMA